MKRIKDGVYAFNDRGPNRSEMPQGYYDRIVRLRQTAQDWIGNNPGKEVKIQFNYPQQAFVIAPITHARDIGLVSHNESGGQLLDAIWPLPADPKKEPTVFMVRMALEGWEDEK